MKTATYLFVDRVSGEEFFVEAESWTKANKIACIWFEEPHNCGVVTDEEADALGYDTY